MQNYMTQPNGLLTSQEANMAKKKGNQQRLQPKKKKKKSTLHSDVNIDGLTTANDAEGSKRKRR
jgi:hypothetical protein